MISFSSSFYNLEGAGDSVNLLWPGAETNSAALQNRSLGINYQANIATGAGEDLKFIWQCYHRTEQERSPQQYGGFKLKKKKKKTGDELSFSALIFLTPSEKYIMK